MLLCGIRFIIARAMNLDLAAAIEVPNTRATGRSENPLATSKLLARNPNLQTRIRKLNTAKRAPRKLLRLQSSMTQRTYSLTYQLKPQAKLKERLNSRCSIHDYRSYALDTAPFNTLTRKVTINGCYTNRFTEQFIV